MTPKEWEKHSIMDPAEFNVFFKDDFTKLAGLVAEGIYRRRFNYKASKGDFRQWVGTTLLNWVQIESHIFDTTNTQSISI
jgi:hypothetical protein